MRIKTFKSKQSRLAARLALMGASKGKTIFPRRHSVLKHPGARFIHGGPDNLKHSRWEKR